MYFTLRIPERFSNNKLVVSLSIFLFVLPFSEALKHFAFLLLVLVWLNHLTKENDKLRLDILDLIAISIPLLGFVTAALSPFGTMKIAEANLDSVRLFFLWFVVRRMKLSVEEMNYLWFSMASGVLLGLLLSHFNFFAFGTGQFGQLPSVGHINHTAIYLTFACAWTLIISVQTKSSKLRLASLMILGGLVFALFSCGSRGAIGAFCFFLLIYFVFLIANRGLASLFRYCVPMLALLLAASLLSPGFYRKQNIPDRITLETVLPDRVPIWRAALIASERNLLLGTGAGTYRQAVAPERIASTDHNRNSNLSFQAHAHNLFVNWVVERGIFALILLVIFLSLSALSLWRVISVFDRGKRDDGLYQTTVWCGAAALLILIIAGIPNTTLHHEHGALAVILLAFGLKQKQVCSSG